jgi:hypothetical protein
MIRQLLLRPYTLAEPWLRHDKWLIRRTAQAAVMAVAAIWLVLPQAEEPEGVALEGTDELVQQLSSSERLRDFLHGPAIVKPFVGRLCRVLLLRLSVAAKARERARSDDRNFLLRLNGPIDQIALRNLLVWHNHILPTHLRLDDSRQVDMALVLPGRSENTVRLFDLLSVALMLDRFRSFALFWDEEGAEMTASILMSNRELTRWREAARMGDLGGMPREITSRVELEGTRGGIKLLSQGRKNANDFFKLALPCRLIVAVGLREREDGAVDDGELEIWLERIDALAARHPDATFVMLNCVAPSQWREYPAYVRFARQHGLTLQDCICLAQIADAYLGVLDILGLAAHSAGRRGVYLPLEDGGLTTAEGPPQLSGARQIMVGSRDRARVDAALESFTTDRH